MDNHNQQVPGRVLGVGGGGGGVRGGSGRGRVACFSGGARGLAHGVTVFRITSCTGMEGAKKSVVWTPFDAFGVTGLPGWVCFERSVFWSSMDREGGEVGHEK